MAKKKTIIEEEIKPIETDLEQKKFKEFFDKVTALSREMGYDIGAKLEIGETGIKAVPFIFKVKPPNEKKV